MIALVGYTGFVGSNIYISAGSQIDVVYHSKNIEKAYGTNPDLLIYAGLRAEKYLANQNPQKDMALITQAEGNIEKINPKKLILVSTIDVFKNPKEVDENSIIETDGLSAYGYNRYQLELWVRARYTDALIIRLPALYGKNIKKNYIYDYIHKIPFMLDTSQFEQLSDKEPKLKEYYQLQDNGFYKVNVSDEKQEELKGLFRMLGFSALNFTDSRSRYQFYNLAGLWKDMHMVMNAGITLWHPAVEPVSAGEVYQYLTGEEFINELAGMPADYDYRTIHDDLFHGKNGYICRRESVLNGIKEFVEESLP